MGPHDSATFGDTQQAMAWHIEGGGTENPCGHVLWVGVILLRLEFSL